METKQCKRWVVSDQERLVKPAGFSVESRVRQVTEVMYTSEIKPDKLCVASVYRCAKRKNPNIELFLHDLENGS